MSNAGPSGLEVTFPSSTTSSSLPTASTGKVIITNLPVNAVSWQYSINSGSVWKIMSPTIRKFSLTEAVYSIHAIQVKYTDASGNDSAAIINTSQITIDYKTNYTPVLPTTNTGSKVFLDSFSTNVDLSDTTIVGNSPTEKRLFTSLMMRSLFASNSAGNQLVLKTGGVLPGFSDSLTENVHLINASWDVSFNRKTTLNLSDIFNHFFYILLESGDSITVHSLTDTVDISKSGDVFTMTTTKNGIHTATIGDLYSYDGLVVIVGSVYGTIVAPNINVVLRAMNTQIGLNTSAEMPYYSSLSNTSDALLTLTTSVPATILQSTFYFRTDSYITPDSSFSYYYVDKSKWTNLQTVINPKNGTITGNAYVLNDNISKDFMRDLSRQLFGTYKVADLFTNEDAIVTDINAKCDTVAVTIDSLITSIDKTTGTLSGMMQDSSGNKYFGDNDSTSNISRELFLELITYTPERFSDLKSNWLYNEGSLDDGYYKMPILPGDVFTFKLTLSPASDQLIKVPTGTSEMATRSYTVVLNIS